MARIKCLYKRYRCGHGDIVWNGAVCEHHNFCGNGHEYDENCERGDCEPYQLENGMIAIPLQCKHVYEEEVMFEKSVKAFEYDSDGLSIRKEDIPESRIIFLQIDDTVFIDKQKDKGETNEVENR